MQHVAIMKKSWGLIPKILSGEKTIESRFYKFKHSPWDKVKTGDIIYFKNTDEPVVTKAKVVKVLQFSDLTDKKISEILNKYGKDLGTKNILPHVRQYASGKNYCILVFFDSVQKIKPFEINKTGFGMMSAWITVSDINKIKITE